jgi:anti-sigma factor RsiW
MLRLAMECERYEDMLSSYVSGDLNGKAAEALEAHLQGCAECRESLDVYRSVAALIADEPALAPTASESAALAQALDRIPMRTPKAQAVTRSSRELAGFALATVAAFAFLVILLGLQSIGRIDLVSGIARFNPLTIAVSAVVVVFVTSFIPIMVTARRRPLNGMTFVR